MKIAIWGCGDRAKYYMEANYFSAADIVAFVETEPSKEMFEGYKVIAAKELDQYISDLDYVVIANEFFENIIQFFKQNSMSLDKLVLTEYICLDEFEQYVYPLKSIAPELFRELEIRPSILVKRNESDAVDDSMILGSGKFGRAIYMEDYYRFRTFELVAKQIIDENVEGSVAEVGVFRGTFSAMINHYFSDRLLYLFDTFEGFDDEEARDEIEKGHCKDSFLIGHKDTSLERAVGNLECPDKAVVCKGLFPNTIPEKARSEKFAFVSLDVDFEKSTFDGLEFFYPRLSEGGMIFIHDYTTCDLHGIKNAVDHYEMEHGIKLKKIPIADKAGTLIIVK